MRKLLITIIFALFTVSAHAESEWSGIDWSNISWPEMEWPSVDWDDYDFSDMDLNPFDLKGLTPRYAFIRDENLIGKTHYVGVSYFQKKGVISDGVTARIGFGELGTKFNLAYTNMFSFLGIDIGLSYTALSDDNTREYNAYIEGLGLELGARMWVVQVIAVHMEETSYVNLAYGF